MANEEKKKSQKGGTESKDESVVEKLDYAAEQVMAFSKSHKLDAAAFVVMVFGFLATVTMINPTIGASIVGIITGFYFGGEILSYLKNLNTHIEREGIFKSLILGVAVLSLFVTLPYFFIGAAAVVGLLALTSNSGAASA